MSESFKETLNLLKDSDLSDFSKFSLRGIEKESLRVFDKTISLTDHPKFSWFNFDKSIHYY